MLSAQSDQQQLNLLLDQKKKKKEKRVYLVFRPFPLFSSFLSRGDPVSPDTTGGSAIAHLKIIWGVTRFETLACELLQSLIY